MVTKARESAQDATMVSVLRALDIRVLLSPSVPASMFAAKSRKWFELCFVPLIPLGSRQVWVCGICQLQTDMQSG